jgi:hypothetical protein
MSPEFQGIKLVVLDEVSMISLSSLYEIHSRLKAIKLASIDDKKERDLFDKANLPFGGIHMLFCGDFYQLKPVGGSPLYQSNVDNICSNAKLGRDLWLQISTYFELTENCRFVDGEDATFPQFIHNARIGQVDETALDKINYKCLCVDVQEAMIRANRKAVWIAPTRAKVAEHNDRNFEMLKAEGAYYFRIIAVHKATSQQQQAPNEEELAELFKNNDKDYPTHLDIAIGSRVRVTENLATQLGVFNGCIGTVVAIAFSDNKPHIPSSMPEQSMAKTHDREQPIVMVQMDDDVGFSISNEPDKKNILPFFAKCSFYHTFTAGGKRFHRYCLPLALASATTCHKAQGITAKYGIVVDPSDIYSWSKKQYAFATGLEYVACSRTTSMEDNKLLLLGHGLCKNHFTLHHSASKNLRNDWEMIENEYIRFKNII